MNKRLNYKNEMFWTTLNVLLKYKPVWEIIPVIVLLVAEFTKLLEKIKETAMIAGVSLTGVTGEKNATLEDLHTVLFEFTSALAAFAHRTNNFELLSQVDFPESHLDGLRQSEVIRLAEKVIVWANENLTALADYDITAADVTELKSITTLFSNALPSADVSMAERKAANERLPLEIAETEELLKKQMDKLMVKQRRKNPEFYSAYDNSREVHNYGVRHEKKEEGTTDDKPKI